MNYDINDFNEEGILTPGTFLSLVTFYISRFLFFGPISLIGGFRGFSGGRLDLSYLTDVSPFAMASSIPAVLIIYTMISRKPNSHPFIKKLWSWGKPLLIGSLIAQIVILGLEVYTAKAATPVHMTFGFLNFFFLIYLTTSNRPKDVFDMFPGQKKGSVQQE